MILSNNSSMEGIDKYISETVHEMYYGNDDNCALTSLYILCYLFGIELDSQTIVSTVCMHGAGGYRAQCGLVEGPLMAIGIICTSYGWEKKRVVDTAKTFASEFEKKFGSLRCMELRPGGFSPSDPPHLCEELSVRAIKFSYSFLKDAIHK